MRAGEGGKKTFLREELRRLEMEFPVATQGIRDSLASSGKRRGIENDQVVLLLTPSG